MRIAVDPPVSPMLATLARELPAGDDLDEPGLAGLARRAAPGGVAYPAQVSPSSTPPPSRRPEHAFGVAGIVRAARRPPGWVAPGPRPAAPSPAERPDLWPAANEDLCYLTGDWRLLQRVDGHRWSVDDLVCAWSAAGALAAGAAPRLTIDLGCGIGSVLMMVAWRFPGARAVGVEAQDLSVGLARRSIAFNGAEDRCEVRHADFRDAAITADVAGAADLVTGTPPYFPRGQGSESPLPQRAPCRFEHRGGIEDYCRAAAPLLAPGAPFVVVEGGGQRERVFAAASEAGLKIEAWRDVIPRAGKAPLISVAVMRRADAAGALVEGPDLVIRDAAGRWTDEFRRVREEMGMPANDGFA